MKNEARIILKPALDSTTEEVRDARARALCYAFDRYFEKQKGAKTSVGEKGSGERRAPSKRNEDRSP
jgi:hypothetical protein